MQKNPDGTYKIKFTYKNQKIKCPSINIKSEEYELLRENKSKKIKIIRTRRGMIWRKIDRLEYESTHVDQYSKEEKFA